MITVSFKKTRVEEEDDVRLKLSGYAESQFYVYWNPVPSL